MQIRWTVPAAEDLEQITRYIQQDDPSAALQVARTIYDGCESLVLLPHRGRKGKLPCTREIVFTPLPYVAVYRVTDSIVEILHIWHGAQDR